MLQRIELRNRGCSRAVMSPSGQKSPCRSAIDGKLAPAAVFADLLAASLLSGDASSRDPKAPPSGVENSSADPTGATCPRNDRQSSELTRTGSTRRTVDSSAPAPAHAVTRAVELIPP